MTPPCYNVPVSSVNLKANYISTTYIHTQTHLTVLSQYCSVVPALLTYRSYESLKSVSNTA